MLFLSFQKLSEEYKREKSIYYEEKRKIKSETEIGLNLEDLNLLSNKIGKIAINYYYYYCLKNKIGERKFKAHSFHILKKLKLKIVFNYKINFVFIRIILDYI